MIQEVGEGSQPLFDDDTETSQKSLSLTTTRKKAEETSCKFNHKDHWLFSGEQEEDEEDALTVRTYSLKSISEAYDEYIQQVQKHCTSVARNNDATPSLAIKQPIQVHESALFDNDTKTILRDNVVKYKRNMSEDCFPKSYSTQSDILKTDNVYAFPTRQLPPRRAKKLTPFDIDITSDDDDSAFFEKAEVTKRRRQQKQQQQKQEKSKKHLNLTTPLLQSNVVSQSAEEKNDGDLRSKESVKAATSSSTTTIHVVDKGEEGECDEPENKRRKLGGNTVKSNISEMMKKNVRKGIKVITDVFRPEKKVWKPPVVDDERTNENDSDDAIHFDGEPPPALKINSKVTPDLIPCPLCNKNFTARDINDHAFHCLGPTSPRASRSQSQNIKQDEKESLWEKASSGLQKELPPVSTTRSEPKLPTKSLISVTKSSESPSKRPNFITTLERSNTTAKASSSTSSSAINRQKRQPTTSTRKEKSQLESLCKGYTTNNISTTSKSRRKNVFQRDDDGEDDKEIFDDYMLTVHSKKPMKTYAGKKKTRGGNFFNDSMDNGQFRCSKCEKEFPEEIYQAHTKECLEDSTLTFS